MYYGLKKNFLKALCFENIVLQSDLILLAEFDYLFMNLLCLYF